METHKFTRKVHKKKKKLSPKNEGPGPETELLLNGALLQSNILSLVSYLLWHFDASVPARHPSLSHSHFFSYDPGDVVVVSCALIKDVLLPDFDRPLPISDTSGTYTGWSVFVRQGLTIQVRIKLSWLRQKRCLWETNKVFLQTRLNFKTSSGKCLMRWVFNSTLLLLPVRFWPGHNLEAALEETRNPRTEKEREVTKNKRCSLEK